MHAYITERGDLSDHISAATKRLNIEFNPTEDILVAISKKASQKSLQNLLLQYKEHTIFHATITGWGGTNLEPGAPHPLEALNGVKELIAAGFPAKQVVLRVDPIIPTDEGIQKAETVLKNMPAEIGRVRFSIIDRYAHCNFLPWQGFQAPKHMQENVMRMLKKYTHGKMLEACGEPQLQENRGCISPRDFEILGKPAPKSTGFKKQRPGCMCIQEKTELLTMKGCSVKCKYCYYKFFQK